MPPAPRKGGGSRSKPRYACDKFTLLGNSRENSLTKLLLTDLVGDGGDPLEGYRLYLSRTVNLRLSHKTLAGLGGEQLERFYKLDEPLENPMFLDMTEPRHLGMLDSLFGVRIVLARAPGSTDATTWTRVFDNRIHCHMLTADSSSHAKV